MDGLIRDPQGRPIFIALPERVALMESATNRLWEILKRLSLRDLMALQPTGAFIALIDTLIDIRTLMAEDLPTAEEIETLERRRLLYRT